MKNKTLLVSAWVLFAEYIPSGKIPFLDGQVSLSFDVKEL